MKIKEVSYDQKKDFNQAVSHPLQSWQWGEFRKKTGMKVVRLGVFQKNTLIKGFQLTIHPVPYTNYTIGYLPKGIPPDKTILKALTEIGQENNCLFIKMEPNILAPNQKLHQFLLENGCQIGRPLFTKYTFCLDLTKPEKEILSSMKSKTRYNIRLSEKKGVQVIEDNSREAFEAYLELLWETTQRQKFYAHTQDYHRKMWQTLAHTGMYHLFLAKLKEKVLAAYVFFTFKDVLYYPYGGSTREHRKMMPPYALFWEAIKFGKKMNCQTFDMWGTPGPDPDPEDPWFGFHRFKLGFGPKLVEFIGTYDLVINPKVYPLFTFSNDLRWKLLNFKSQILQ